MFYPIKRANALGETLQLDALKTSAKRDQLGELKVAYIEKE